MKSQPMKNAPHLKRLARLAGLLAMSALLGGWVSICLAGETKKWEEIPEAVRKTILAHGGKAGPVDKESEKINGKAVYEASVKDKDGSVRDLVVTEDGKLVEIKTDDAANKTDEQTASARKALASLKFTRPLEITHPFLPLATLKQDILEGTEGGKKVRVERTRMPQTKTIQFNGKPVEALVFEDRVFENGKLAEVALDYYAQADDGTVCYLGEDVDEYKDGKVIGHEGTWLLGKDTQIPGVIMPARPKVGDKFKVEDVSKEIHEDDEVLSVSETVTVPAGTYKNCLKIKEVLADGKIEFKYFARGVGCVKEVPADGELLLKSHETTKAKK